MWIQKGPKSKDFPLNIAFDLIPFLGFNAGSLLRIPRAWLLSGTERLGSLKERKGYRECWAIGRAFAKENACYLQRIPGQITLCGD